MPRILEQSGLLFVVPTPRDAGGTTLVCVATRARLALVVSRAELGVFGSTVCWGICWGIAFEAGLGFDAEGFEAGVAAEGVGEDAAVGAGADGDGDVAG
jgi:hypothetical protein